MIKSCSMKALCLSLACAVVWMFPSGASAEVRTWKNPEGVEIQAEFLRAEGESVTLRMTNGKTVTFSQDKLSEADREWIQALPEDQRKGKRAASVPANRKAGWLTQMEKAKKEAEDTGLPILVLFTGTEWCPYCIKLEKEVFRKSEFKDFANQNLVLVIYDFARNGKASAEAREAAKQYRVGGYPTFFLVTADGKLLGAGGYANGISPKSFAEWVNSIKP